MKIKDSRDKVYICIDYHELVTNVSLLKNALKTLYKK